MVLEIQLERRIIMQLALFVEKMQDSNAVSIYDMMMGIRPEDPEEWQKKAPLRTFMFWGFYHSLKAVSQKIREDPNNKFFITEVKLKPVQALHQFFVEGQCLDTMEDEWMV